MEVILGSEVKDRVTGYTGIAVSITIFLNGCRRVGVQRKMKAKDEKTPDIEMFDEPDLETVGAGVNTQSPETVKVKDRHGDRDFIPGRNRLEKYERQ